MLELEQDQTEYDRPLLTRRRRGPGAGQAEIPEPDVFAYALPIHVEELTSLMPSPTADLDMLTLDEFESLFGDEHQQLAQRKLMGEVLTPRERVRLAALDQAIDGLKPRRDRLPQDVRELVDTVLRTIPAR